MSVIFGLQHEKALAKAVSAEATAALLQRARALAERPGNSKAL